MGEVFGAVAVAVVAIASLFILGHEGVAIVKLAIDGILHHH